MSPERSLLTEISEAGPEDREWAATLLAGSYPWVTLGVGFEQCRRVCTDPRFQVFLASTGAQRSGVLILDEAGVAGAPYLKSIAVAEGLRGKGVGAALMDHCEAWAGMRSRHLFLCVSSFNTLARAFYERRGFTEVGELQDFIIPGASEVLMHRLVR